MILAIDGYEANVESRVGIGRYAYEILRHMHTILSNREGSDVSVRVYIPEKPRTDMPPETPFWRYRVAAPKKFWTFIGLPLALASDRPGADVVFSPTHYIPRFVGISRVMSIMDMSFLHYPEMFRPRDLYQLTNWTRFSAMKARRILTISEYSKNAIINSYHVPESRIRVTYPGLTMDLKTPKKSFAHLKKTYGVGDHYILSVGTLQPRKNYVRLIEAFSRLVTRDSTPNGLQLVIVGKKGWLYEEILGAPGKFGVEKRVRFLEFVPDGDLPSLYTYAQCLALPSLYEGFGLPVLEALSLGCPVVISDVSSLPEIAGKAGIYVKPDDVGSIADGLSTALGEHNTAKGKKRIVDGEAQASRFTWEKAAKETLEVLEQTAADKQ